MPSDDPPSVEETHAFVLRIRKEGPAVGRVPDLPQAQDETPQDDDSPLRIRIEHVGSNDIGQATTIPDALNWLETRMRRLFPGASRQRPPSPKP